MKRLLSILFLVLLISCKTSVPSKDKAFEKRDLLREYAVCRCMFLAYGKDSINLKKIDASPSVYLDITGYDMYKVSKIDSIVDSFVKKITPLQHEDYSGKSAIFLNCMELYYSKEIRKISKQGGREKIGKQWK